MAPAYREVGVRELSDEDRENLERAQTALGLSSPLVGGFAAPGLMSRGLLLHQGQTWLLRVQPLSTSVSALALQFFLALQKQCGDQLLARVSGTTLYFARRFYKEPAYPTTAASDEESLSRRRQQAYAFQIISELSLLHEQDLFHGHFVESNLFKMSSSESSDGALMLVDHGVNFFSSSDAGKFTDLSTLARYGIKRDHSLLLSFLRRRMSNFSVDEFEPLLGSSEFLPGIEQKLKRKKEKSARSRSASSGASSSKAKNSGSQGPSDAFPYLVFILCIVAGFAVYHRYDVITSYYRRIFESSYTELRTLWLSKNPASMVEVGRRAVFENDSVAQQVIVGSVERGYSDSSILLSKSLLFASSSDWFSELNDQDKTALFAFALAPLLGGELKKPPSLAQVHPGVLIALLVGLPEGKSPVGLYKLLQSTSRSIPDELVKAFRYFKGKDPKEAARPFQGYLQLANGLYSIPALDGLFPRGISAEELSARLKLLYPTLSEDQAKLVWKHLEATDIGGSYAGWFRAGSVVDWSKVGPKAKLGLIAGLELPQKLSTLQLADLSSAPFLPTDMFGISESLAERIGKSGFKEFFQIVYEDQTLSREQTILLVSALTVGEEKSFDYVKKWLDLKPKPDPDLVLSLLISLSEQEQFDAFNLQAARYLRKKEFPKLSVPQLARLARHPEPLARGLAYAKADISNEAELSILKQRLQEEDKSRLREYLARKVAEPEEADLEGEWEELPEAEKETVDEEPSAKKKVENSTESGKD